MVEIKKINIGTKPDDGTGDTLRDAFSKTNDNFEALNTLPKKGDKGDKGEPGKDLSSELDALTKRVKALEEKG
ncbi:hypothetical protein [Arsenophonus nasoniae]|uniref:Uncharacterized protein n=1 Tax=Arsenophonus nasoniae TaxID=638 RepID=A0AA95K4M0_9GAMM|nr:hypothetical protein [Arsenophonus nasoniae]WGM00022.1 hypothetical protein QE210_08885 [Arsenophonus nasoniae]WGM00215.1 hypothetical protein QE210_09950 [Arsenophonus nasoniae]WGM02446.1 hypothetical protein QE210_04965 [Arsenophonus nasoniae]